MGPRLTRRSGRSRRRSRRRPWEATRRAFAGRKKASACNYRLGRRLEGGSAIELEETEDGGTGAKGGGVCAAGRDIAAQMVEGETFTGQCGPELETGPWWA